MAEPPEGGGKLRSKRLHGTKPYARSEDGSKSLLRRMTDGVASILLPSWMSWPLTNNHVETDGNMETDGNVDSSHQSSLDADLANTVTTSDVAENNFVLPSTAHKATHGMTATTPVLDRRTRSSTRDDLLSEGIRRDSGTFSANSVVSGDYGSWPDNKQLRNVVEKYPSSSTSDNPAHLSAAVKDTVPDNRSDCSDTSVSTSGCSSMIPHPDKREYQKEILQLTDTSLLQLSEKLTKSCLPTATARPPLHSSTPSTSLGSRRISSSESFSVANNGINKDSVDGNSLEEKDGTCGLWCDMTRVSETSSHESLRNSTPHSRPQSRAIGNKPSFSVSAFGNPVWNDRSVLNESLLSSPYYSGPTSFGGASAQRRNKYQSCFPYEAPNKRQDVKLKPRNSVDVNNLDGMSSTARKILETLEKMSTPIKDAHRIPATKNYLDTLPTLNRSSVRRPKLSGFDHANVRNGPPTNTILTPSSSKTRLSLVQPSVTSASQSYNAKSSLSTPLLKSTAPAAPEPTYSNKTSDSRKIKSSRLGGMHYTKKTRPEDEIEEDYELPNIPMPISSLPTFQFDLTAVKPNVSKTTSLTSTTTTTSLPTFDFCLPSLVDVVSNGKTSKQESDKRVKFTFSSPLKVVESDEEMEEVVVSKTQTTPMINFTSGSSSTPSFKPKMKTVETDSSKVFPVASEVKQTGSVMDILKKVSGKETTPKKKREKSRDSTTRLKKCWSCPTCSINNGLDADKCAACQTLKPGTSAEPIATTSISALPSASIGFGDKFKPPSGNWTCAECYVSNKSDTVECVACTTRKPGSAPVPTSSVQTKSESTFGDKFKPPSGSWICDTCMVPNKAQDTKCIACESLKPGTIAAPPETKFKFGFSVVTTTPTSSTTTETTSVGSSGFKFGTDVTSSASSPSTFKFGTSTSSNVSFGSSSTKSENKFGGSSTSEIKFGNSAATSEFKFGNSSSTSVTTTSASGGFVFGSQPKESDKSPPSFTFGASAMSQKTTPEIEKPVTTTSVTLTTNSSAEKEVESKESSTSIASTGFSFATRKFPEVAEVVSLNKEPEIVAPTFSFGGSSSLKIPETSPSSIQSIPTTGMELSNKLTGTKRESSELFDEPPRAKIPSMSSFSSNTFNKPSISQGTLFNTAPVTTASTTDNMFSIPKTTSTSSLGSVSTTPFGGNTSQALTNIFSPQSTLSAMSKPLFGTFSTASSVFGTTSTNSVLSPTSSAAIYQSQAATSTTFSTPPTTTTTFFGTLTPSTTPSAPSTFSTDKPISFSFTPTTTSTKTFGTPVTTASFAQSSTPTNPLFNFGSQSTSKPIAGNIFSSQTSTPTTTAASTFNAFGSTINTNPSTNTFGGFGAPRAAGSNPIPAFGTPATAPAPSNRFQFNSAPSFQFAETQPSTDGVFQFTGNHDTPSQPEQAATTFQFNQPTTAQAGYQFNAGANPNFNFGTNAASNPGSNILNPTPSLGAFNTGPTFRFETPNSGSRQIRRATRRRK